MKLRGACGVCNELQARWIVRVDRRGSTCRRRAAAAGRGEARRALGLEPSGKTTCTTAEVAAVLGISVESVRSAIGCGDLAARSVQAMTNYGRRDFWRVELAGITEVL